MKIFNDWYWDDTGLLMLTIAALAVFWVGVWAVCMDHRVRYYYVTSETSSGISACVVADINWLPDDKTWCSGDIDKIIDASQRLNEQLKVTRGK